MIDDSRVRELSDAPLADGRYVLYWMQQSQRARFNPALELAVRRARDLGLPVLVGFGLMDDYPAANARHYLFLLQGLREVARDLARRGIGFVIRRGAPARVALELAREAALVICDRGYQRHQKAWRREVAAGAERQVLEVEGDVLVPVEIASHKAEYAARTIRGKLRDAWDFYLAGLSESKVGKRADSLALQSDLDLRDPAACLKTLSVDHSVPPVSRFVGGYSQARNHLRSFLRQRLDGYAEGRSEPAAYQVSYMSPYLHFGQISPVEVALAVKEASSGSSDDRASYLEELLVRRELAANFVMFTDNYDSYDCLPSWARKTLAEHADDDRPHRYSRRQLQAAATADEYWNAAMREMTQTGYMHNYMRMYWGKKIIEWSGTPRYAYATALTFNNTYFIDGRDCNSFANVAWCFGLHDRAWAERDIFGKIRYMNHRGLDRKFDMPAYVAAVDALVAAEAHQ